MKSHQPEKLTAFFRLSFTAFYIRQQLRGVGHSIVMGRLEEMWTETFVSFPFASDTEKGQGHNKNIRKYKPICHETLFYRQHAFWNSCRQHSFFLQWVVFRCRIWDAEKTKDKRVARLDVSKHCIL